MYLYLGLNGADGTSGFILLGLARPKTVVPKTHWLLWMLRESFSSRGRPLGMVIHASADMHCFDFPKV